MMAKKELQLKFNSNNNTLWLAKKGSAQLCKMSAEKCNTSAYYNQEFWLIRPSSVKIPKKLDNFLDHIKVKPINRPDSPTHANSLEKGSVLCLVGLIDETKIYHSILLWQTSSFPKLHSIQLYIPDQSGKKVCSIF